MMRSCLSSLCCLFLVACGGSTPPPEAPPADDPMSEPGAASEPAAAGDSDPGDDAWEGEAEATGAPAEATAAGPGAGGTEETRTVEVLTKIIKDNRQRVRDCYEKAQKDLPSLQGDMVIFILLDPEGKVKKIELNQERSTLKSPAVVDCAINVIKSLSFPPSSRGMETTLNYPFNFKPR